MQKKSAENRVGESHMVCMEYSAHHTIPRVEINTGERDL